MTRPHELAEHLLSLSRARQTQVVVTSTATVNTRWARNTLTTNGDTTGTDVTVIAIEEGARGVQVASLTRPAADLDARELVDQALRQARDSEPAWDAMPLPPMSGGAAAGWGDPPATASATDLAGVLADLGAELNRDAEQEREHFGYLELQRTSTWLATSAGVALRHDQPAARLEMTVKSHGRSRSTWQGFAGEDLAGADIAGLAATARSELGWQGRTIEVPPGRRPAILRASCVADLMVDLLWGADARAAAEGRSVFSGHGGGTRLGERLSSRPLRLASDPRVSGLPFLVTTMSHDAASVFDNGLPLQATDWIADGRLAALVSSRAAAARSGLPLALAPDNLLLDALGTGTPEDLLSRTADGLLVTCTWYNRMVDPQRHLITGLTRDGVYVVRDGEVLGRAGNFRFNDSPVALLDRITDASEHGPALGREVADYFTRTSMPALVVADFNFSSASEAV